MSTPHDGTDHTGNGSRPPHDQPSSAIPTGEHIIGGPGCPACFPRQNEPTRTLEERTPNLQRVLKRLEQQRHILWPDSSPRG